MNKDIIHTHAQAKANKDTQSDLHKTEMPMLNVPQTVYLFCVLNLEMPCSIWLRLCAQCGTQNRNALLKYTI